MMDRIIQAVTRFQALCGYIYKKAYPIARRGLGNTGNQQNWFIGLSLCDAKFPTSSPSANGKLISMGTNFIAKTERKKVQIPQFYSTAEGEMRQFTVVKF